MYSEPINVNLVPNSTFSQAGFEMFKCYATETYDQITGALISVQTQDLLLYIFNNNQSRYMNLEYPDRIGGYVVFIGPDLNNLR